MGLLPSIRIEKNFNSCHHEEDFGISAERHFSATAHEKGACDSIKRTVKRLAARATLHKPYNDEIMTPRQLFDWAVINVPSVHFDHCSIDDHEVEKKCLEQRFMKARTIPGTRKLHSFIPNSKDKLQVKTFSVSHSWKEERVTTTEDDLPPESISGFVTCTVDKKWWLACVLHLTPLRPSMYFRYPPTDHTVKLATKDVLTSVDPRTRTGRVHTLSQKEIKSAPRKLS